MAKQTVTTLVDDIDGNTDEVTTFTIGYAGATYEVDLGGANAEALSDQLDLVITHGRKLGKSPLAAGKAGARKRDPEVTKIREWALAHGKISSTRGRIPAAVEAEYRAAN